MCICHISVVGEIKSTDTLIKKNTIIYWLIINFNILTGTLFIISICNYMNLCVISFLLFSFSLINPCNLCDLFLQNFQSVTDSVGTIKYNGKGNFDTNRLMKNHLLLKWYLYSLLITFYFSQCYSSHCAMDCSYGAMKPNHFPGSRTGTAVCVCGVKLSSTTCT
jgi:hypothetical protein